MKDHVDATRKRSLRGFERLLINGVMAMGLWLIVVGLILKVVR